MPQYEHQPCSVVLVRCKYPGNLGAVARVMANFGVKDLRLVSPQADPLSLEARALASHGEYLLETARHYDSLVDAVQEMVWVAGTSARIGGLFRKQNVLNVRDGMAMGSTASARGRIALVFGPEDHGLTNEEVSQCHYQLHIPAAPDYNVLNLAQAVGITLYEWYQVSQPTSREEPAALASAGDLAQMYGHLEASLRAIHFIWGEKGESVAHALRHLLYRAQPTESENKLLHGLARQLQWYVEHHPPAAKKEEAS